MTLVSPLVLTLAITFLVVAAIAGLVALAVAVQFVVSNRSERLARHESMGTYYRSLVSTH